CLSAEELPALNGKPAANLGGGGRVGTVRAQAHLRYVLLHNDVKLLNKPELMIPRASQFFDEEGRLVDEELRERLRDLLDALYEWTLLFRHR
ncbi:hypothetical protein RY27_04995, partial [Litorilinea aerophila]